MEYKWSGPHEWLADHTNPLNPKNSAEYLYNALCCLALQVDSDTIQDVFQDEMDETGYFDEIGED